VSKTPAINCSAVSTTPLTNLLAVSLTPAINLCHGFSLIGGVVDTGNKFITGVVDTAEKWSPVTTTKKPKIYRWCQRHRRKTVYLCQIIPENFLFYRQCR
jgi:hypothetical protein